MYYVLRFLLIISLISSVAVASHCYWCACASQSAHVACRALLLFDVEEFIQFFTRLAVVVTDACYHIVRESLLNMYLRQILSMTLSRDLAYLRLSLPPLLCKGGRNVFHSVDSSTSWHETEAYRSVCRTKSSGKNSAVYSL